MSGEPGLRERKKQQTRREIADTAEALFAERGFEHVTVAEVARAANVSDKTVFNYFPTKEDLFFDEYEAMETGLVRALTERDRRDSVLDACRRFYAGGLSRMAQQEASGPLAAHAKILAASPALQERQREIFHLQEQTLAREVAVVAGADGDKLEPRVIAAAVIGVVRALQERGLAQLARGREPASPDALRDDLERAFDLLANGLRDYGRGGA